MRRLSETELKATMGKTMERLVGGVPPFDFWAYFEALPAAEFGGYDFSEGEIESVYVEPRGRYQHVLVECTDRDVFFVLVLDLEQQAVHGHRLLNLRVEYGLDP